MLEKQSFAVRILKAHRTHARIAHAYLFTGGSVNSQEEMALAWACALECSPERFGECSCHSCRQIHEGVHPDVRWIGRDVKAKSIKIEEIREVLGSASLKPYAASWKVFIVHQSERMTTEASNALLKTLEEPPAHTVFILTAAARTSLIETIQSRCFEVRLFPEHDAHGLESERFASLKGGGWAEALEAWQEWERPELALQLERLGEDLHKMGSEPASGQTARRLALASAADKTLEVREAVQDNVNVKLALTRLAMHLERLCPLENLK